MLITISNKEKEEWNKLENILSVHNYKSYERDRSRFDVVYELIEVQPQPQQEEKENEMAQLLNPFDASQVDPIGPLQQFPIGTHKVVIVGNEVKATAKEDGGLLELTLQIIEGEFAGLQAPYRLNLYNKSEKAVEIAYRQLSAICHVVGVFQVQNADVLMNIPFCVVVGMQKKAKESDPDYTEIKGVKDINGNDPGKHNQAQQQTQQQPQQNQQQAQWGNQQQNQAPQQQQQNTGWNQPQQQQNQAQGNTWQQQPQQNQQQNSGAPAWAQPK